MIWAFSREGVRQNQRLKVAPRVDGTFILHIWEDGRHKALFELKKTDVEDLALVLQGQETKGALRDRP